MLVFVDTETTGLIDWRLPITHPSQPRLVELAAYACDETDNYCHVESINQLIYPDGWTILEGAQATHGISFDQARTFGEPLRAVLQRLTALLHTLDADSADRIVAHNFSFDHRILLSEYLRLDMPCAPLNTILPFCTMRALTPRMKLPSARGRAGEYKWPSLIEAHRFCFDSEPPESHRAMSDALACRDIFIHGRKQGWWK